MDFEERLAELVEEALSTGGVEMGDVIDALERKGAELVAKEDERVAAAAQDEEE